MVKWCSALLAAAVLLVAPASAHALELGISDGAAAIEQRDDWSAQIHATWERYIVSVGQPGVAARIRASHAAGRKVILTVGGNGTRSRRPSFTRALRYIATLPRADRYTIDNEPDLDGTRPCTYRNGWMKARRVLGRRLLWGDTVSMSVTFTLAAAKCGRIPKRLAFAVHPYQWVGNPLYPTHAAKVDTNEAALGNLPHARRTLAAHGIRVDWWLTEFGYASARSDEIGLRMDGLTDEKAAWMWPRALMQARRVQARALVIYMAQGPTWDTRPGEQAWAAIRNAM